MARLTPFAAAGPVAVCLLGGWLLIEARPGTAFGVFPRHFLLHPGEQIHYTACRQLPCGDAEYATRNAEIVRLVKPSGLFEALRPGRTELVVRLQGAEQRIPIRVAGPAEAPLSAVPHTAIQEIVAKDLLFVGHANLDGYDHTAVAKPGIDRLVQEARKKGWTVVYWVSQEYPNWYTSDRHPDYAIISEGQEHQIRIRAERILFTGGGYTFCLARNVQMTLHAMLQHDAPSRIHFVLRADAIWKGPDDGKPYPAPMALLATSFSHCANDADAYEKIAVPFLDIVVHQYPVAHYPADPPAPPLNDLLAGWNIVVRFADRFERFYRRADSSKTLVIEFQGI